MILDETRTTFFPDLSTNPSQTYTGAFLHLIPLLLITLCNIFLSRHLSRATHLLHLLHTSPLPTHLQPTKQQTGPTHCSTWRETYWHESKPSIRNVPLLAKTLISAHTLILLLLTWGLFDTTFIADSVAMMTASYICCFGSLSAALLGLVLMYGRRRLMRRIEERWEELEGMADLAVEESGCWSVDEKAGGCGGMHRKI
ncbi:hypothetical protein B0J11DRAFT_583141 [Dendryphion nanum]|uniref:Uncharacterized protein n=1 Tax=Dendryphion nanum TaxID=256645 RepID=A0A9P9DEF1_9PLEO|nr:hypothetical protein B0J11DRAFT_583141 [Dendryphion nanum]